MGRSRCASLRSFCAVVTSPRRWARRAARPASRMLPDTNSGSASSLTTAPRRRDLRGRAIDVAAIDREQRDLGHARWRRRRTPSPPRNSSPDGCGRSAEEYHRVVVAPVEREPREGSWIWAARRMARAGSSCRGVAACRPPIPSAGVATGAGHAGPPGDRRRGAHHGRVGRDAGRHAPRRRGPAARRRRRRPHPPRRPRRGADPAGAPPGAAARAPRAPAAADLGGVRLRRLPADLHRRAGADLGDARVDDPRRAARLHRPLGGARRPPPAGPALAGRLRRGPRRRGGDHRAARRVGWGGPDAARRPAGAPRGDHRLVGLRRRRLPRPRRLPQRRHHVLGRRDRRAAGGPAGAGHRRDRRLAGRRRRVVGRRRLPRCDDRRSSATSAGTGPSTTAASRGSPRSSSCSRSRAWCWPRSCSTRA